MKVDFLSSIQTKKERNWNQNQEKRKDREKNEKKRRKRSFPRTKVPLQKKERNNSPQTNNNNKKKSNNFLKTFLFLFLNKTGVVVEMIHSDGYNPPKAESFESLNLKPELQKVLNLWGFNKPSPVQVFFYFSLFVLFERGERNLLFFFFFFFFLFLFLSFFFQIKKKKNKH